MGDELLRSEASMVHNLLHQLHSWLQLYCRLCLLQRSMQPYTHPHTLCYPHPTCLAPERRQRCCAVLQPDHHCCPRHACARIRVL